MGTNQPLDRRFWHCREQVTRRSPNQHLVFNDHLYRDSYGCFPNPNASLAHVSPAISSFAGRAPRDPGAAGCLPSCRGLRAGFRGPRRSNHLPRAGGWPCAMQRRTHPGNQPVCGSAPPVHRLARRTSTALPAVDVDDRRSQMTTTAPPTLPNQESIGRWYWQTRAVSAPVRNRWLKISYDGTENVAPAGGALLASNHLSFLDSVILMCALDRQVTFLGKAEYLQNGITRRLFPAAGMIPVDRSGRGVAQSLNQAIARLDRGELVGIFPEGTRSRDGLLHRGHAGVAHMALRARVPIVPIGIIGTDDAMPPGERFPRRGSPVTVRFGAPISIAPWSSGPATGAQKREITDEVMASIAQLSGQAYVDSCSPIPGAPTRPGASLQPRPLSIAPGRGQRSSWLRPPARL